jgi:hypothetical protein
MLDEDEIVSWVEALGELELDELKQVQRILTRCTEDALGYSNNIFTRPEEYANVGGHWKQKQNKKVKTLNINPFADSLDCCALKQAPITNIQPPDEYGRTYGYNGTGWIEINTQENNMYTQTGTQTIDTERRYLSNRLNTIRDEKVSAAYNHFNVGYYPTPKNGKELKEWLANGRVKVADRLEDDHSFAYNSPYHYLEFFDPDKKRDEEGYHKTCDTIYADVTPVKDAIAIFEPTEALKAVQEFEKKTYH